MRAGKFSSKWQSRAQWDCFAGPLRVAFCPVLSYSILFYSDVSRSPPFPSVHLSPFPISGYNASGNLEIRQQNKKESRTEPIPHCAKPFCASRTNCPVIAQSSYSHYRLVSLLLFKHPSARPWPQHSHLPFSTTSPRPGQVHQVRTFHPSRTRPHQAGPGRSTYLYRIFLFPDLDPDGPLHHQMLVPPPIPLPSTYSISLNLRCIIRIHSVTLQPGRLFWSPPSISCCGPVYPA